ncbi:MAG: hypothetical protein NC220_03490 [Clostridium sp.]|nr:hypothetical protein [Clostridium sp.]
MWDFGAWSFLGSLPYNCISGSGIKFTLPFGWVTQYLVLAYLIGGYVRKDMKDYGVTLMIKSSNRVIWWFSKCIWCVLVNVLFFTSIMGVNMVFSWVGGKNNVFAVDAVFMEHLNLSLLLHDNGRFILIVVIPFLVGVLLSMFQIVISLLCGDICAMVILGGIIVCSIYYAHPLLPTGYAMLCRYTAEGATLDWKTGLIYLTCLIMGFCFVGYVIIRKRDIY